MSIENESEKVMAFQDLDKLTCPACKIKGTMVLLRRKIKNQECIQIRCMNPECHLRAYKPVISLKEIGDDKWHKAL